MAAQQDDSERSARRDGSTARLHRRISRAAAQGTSVVEFAAIKRAMSRYLQKISLRPYSNAEIWTGWELEGRTGEIEGLILADGMSAEELAKIGRASCREREWQTE